MPANDYSKNIVYLSKEQYQELITNETLTVNGQTITYNDNDIYVTPQAEPITDVRINGTSIGSNGVANIPEATNATYGVVKVWQPYGIKMYNGTLRITSAPESYIKRGSEPDLPIVPTTVNAAAFYGLAKAAGHDEKDSTESLGTYTPGAKQAIQNMLGITDLLSTEETTTATAAHALSSTFMMNGKLHRATAAIAIGDAVVEGQNCEVVKADEVFVKKTDYATSSVAGIVQPGTGLEMNGARIQMKVGSDSTIQSGAGGTFASIGKQHQVVFFGLSKAAGVDLANETVTVGTYPETSKTAIRSLIGAAAASDIPSVPVQDVQVNGTSVLNSGIANIPMASANALGTVKVGSVYGIQILSDGEIRTNPATDSNIKLSNASNAPIVPQKQHMSVFYGLAKAAGDNTQQASSNAVGIYTESAKASIRTMLGAVSSNVVAVQDEMPTAADNKVWLPETEQQGIQVPTMEDLGDYVKKTDIATLDTPGLVKISTVVKFDSNNRLTLTAATDAHTKEGNNTSFPIMPNRQHRAAFYGLAKAAGDTTQAASDNAVGTYTDNAKAAIQTMLGVPGDVQVNGTSVVSNGVADIPIATTGVLGVVRIGSTGGLSINANGVLMTNPAPSGNIKTGSSGYHPLVPSHQHEATFYGLAKAAGDSTQSASSNAVGTYTNEAKLAIQQMLGIDLSSIASEVEIPLVETVSGTTPSITGQPNTRYNCGEVSTISITPPAAGSIDVIFDSGSTPAVLTVPNTVRWPAWFDASSLEADTTYEILITDGVYGSVMTWAN